ncbi:MAG: hypothetical protein KDA55_04805 [Planctomycetales bacterium]|nr:hypothetical protein [Planctomycetales bacterium]
MPMRGCNIVGPNAATVRRSADDAMQAADLLSRAGVRIADWEVKSSEVKLAID